MKFAGLFISLLLGSAVWAQNKIVADITNFENSRGICQVCLYNNALAFNGEGGKPFQCVKLKEYFLFGK